MIVARGGVSGRRCRGDGAQTDAGRYVEESGDGYTLVIQPLMPPQQIAGEKAGPDGTSVCFTAALNESEVFSLGLPWRIARISEKP